MIDLFPLVHSCFISLFPYCFLVLSPPNEMFRLELKCFIHNSSLLTKIKIISFHVKGNIYKPQPLYVSKSVILIHLLHFYALICITLSIEAHPQYHFKRAGISLIFLSFLLFFLLHFLSLFGFLVVYSSAFMLHNNLRKSVFA